MSLSTPPEPRDIKERILKRKSACSGSGCDAFAVWFGNEVAKYLWDHWGRELSRSGINWQKFLAILGNHTQELIDWAIRGTLSWDELLKIILGDTSIGATSTERRGGGILNYLG